MISVGKYKSGVWEFFELSISVSVTAKCKFCKKDISCGGNCSTTSNLHKHLKTAHAHEIMKAKKEKWTLEGARPLRPLVSDIYSLWNVSLNQSISSSSLSTTPETSPCYRASPTKKDCNKPITKC